jgi:hypothetical protein
MSKYEHERQLEVAAAASDSLIVCRVRRFGYGAVHLAKLPVASVVVLRESRRAFALGAASPIAGICGTRVRSAQPFVRVGEVDRHSAPAYVTCLHCLRELDRRPAALEARPEAEVSR